MRKDLQTQVWQITSKQPLKWRCWDGDYVFYNPLSGQTHLMDIVASQILLSLSFGPLSFADICEQVSRFLGLDSDEKLANNVRQLLVGMDEGGLIEPQPITHEFSERDGEIDESASAP